MGANGKGHPAAQDRPDGGGPAPQSIQIPKQTTYTYPTATAQIVDNGDNGRALIFHAADETHIFPMSSEAAQEIGHKLAAPSIEVIKAPGT